MASSKLFLSLSLLLILLASVTWSPAKAEKASPPPSPGMPCLKNLMPCTPYIKATSPPPATCCVPLKKAVDDDAKCLCQLFNDADVLKSFNVTQDDAIKLAKLCGANASICKTGTAPSKSPTTPSPTKAPGAAAPSGNSTGSAAPERSTPKNGAIRVMSEFGVLGIFFAFLVVDFLN